jgi:hypothetical protein
MTPDHRKRADKKDLLLASVMVVAGLAISGLALGSLATDAQTRMAQATPPLQGTPSTTQGQAPAQAKPGGERPTTPAPEPARPDAEAQKNGATPALPSAPAEKTAAPIKQ